jgi:DNA-binding NarL/FixJ family response regulator
MPDLIRVLIADDHHVVRRGLRGFLETYVDIEVVAEAENGAQAVALAREHVPDVILMDLLMPEMDGIEAIGRIVAFSPATRIIVLTSYTEDDRGMSNREIAEALVIAEGTVKSHVSNILSKLHLAHRTQAALYALKRKLIPLDDPHLAEDD